jgi:biotin operon repressor
MIHGDCQHAADATKTLTSVRDEGVLLAALRRGGTFYELASRAQAALAAVRSAATFPAHPDLFDSELPGSGTNGGSSGTSGSSPGINEAEVPRPETSPASTAEWTALARVAAAVRQRSRATKIEIESAVVALCSRTPLSLTEVAALTGKGRERTRKVIQALMEQGAVGYAYPEAPSSPKQRYVATPRETS